MDVPYKLYQGESLSFMQSLPAASVDAVITDPPYSSGGMVRGDRNTATNQKYQHGDTKDKKPNFSGDTRDQRSWIMWCSLWLQEAKRITKPNGVVIAFSDWRQLPALTDAIQCGGWVWRGIAVWDKGNAIPQPNSFRAQSEFVVWGTNGAREVDYKNGAYLPGVFFCETVKGSEREHVTEKPVSVMKWLAEIVPPNGIIFDPFMGSGTTGIAALQLGRKFIGCELSPEYFAIAERRIKQAEQQPSLWHEAQQSVQRTGGSLGNKTYFLRVMSCPQRLRRNPPAANASR